MGRAAGAGQRPPGDALLEAGRRRCRRWPATPTATRCCSSTQGAGDLFCDYGHLAFEAGDYLYLPRGTMWRLAPASGRGVPDDRGDRRALHACPSAACWAPPRCSIRRCWTPRRMDEAFRAHQDEPGEVARRGEEARRRSRLVTYPYNPLDAVGWHGDLAPVRLNVRDIRPVASHRYHLPPSVHTTFVVGPLRGLHLRAAAVRDRSRRAEGAVLPQQRRLRRGAVLPRRRLLQPRQHRRRDADLPPLAASPTARTPRR